MALSGQSRGLPKPNIIQTWRLPSPPFSSSDETSRKKHRWNRHKPNEPKTKKRSQSQNSCSILSSDWNTRTSSSGHASPILDLGQPQRQSHSTAAPLTCESVSFQSCSLLQNTTVGQSNTAYIIWPTNLHATLRQCQPTYPRW